MHERRQDFIVVNDNVCWEGCADKLISKMKIHELIIDVPQAPTNSLLASESRKYRWSQKDILPNKAPPR